MYYTKVQLRNKKVGDKAGLDKIQKHANKNNFSSLISFLLRRIYRLIERYKYKKLRSLIE